MRQVLKRDFKKVFHNISSILDCVTCQKCKLHGKLALMGLGAALKVLLVPPHSLSAGLLSRLELVSLVNTAAKFSEVA